MIQPATRISHYDLFHRIRSRGTSQVWLARVFRAPEEVSLVELSFSEQPLFNQARLEMMLNHPNILPTVDVSVRAQWIRGCNLQLAYFVRASRPLISLLNLARGAADLERPIPPGLALNVMAQVARALHFAHTRPKPLPVRADEKQAWVHGALNAADIFLDDEGVVKVTGFMLDPRPYGFRLARAEYWSPEHLRGELLVPASDVFSAGVLLFELVTGRRLFKSSSMQDLVDRVLARELPTPSDVRSTLPWAIDRILGHALSRDVARRTQSAGALADALDELRSTLDEPSDNLALRQFALEVCGPEIVRLRELIDEMNAIPPTEGPHARKPGERAHLLTVRPV